MKFSFVGPAAWDSLLGVGAIQLLFWTRIQRLLLRYGLSDYKTACQVFADMIESMCGANTECRRLLTVTCAFTVF